MSYRIPTLNKCNQSQDSQDSHSYQSNQTQNSHSYQSNQTQNSHSYQSQNP